MIDETETAAETVSPTPPPQAEVAADGSASPSESMSPRGSSRRQDPLIDHRPLFVRLTHLFGRVFFGLLAHVTVSGLPGRRDAAEFRSKFPPGSPLIVACNHLSTTDPGMIGTFLGPILDRQFHWLGKEELLGIPFVGWAVAQNGVIGLRRGAADVEAFRLARRVLDEGHVLVVFPEGTRSRNGQLQEAKDGLAILALRSGAPILPIGIAGSETIWPRGTSLRLGGRATFTVGEPFVVTSEGKGDRRAAAGLATRTIMTRIAALLPPSYRGVYADDVELEEPGEGSEGSPVR